MRNFNHVILDFESHKAYNTSKYWVSNILQPNTPGLVFVNSIDMFSKFSDTKKLKNFSHSYKKMTLKYSASSDVYNTVPERVADFSHLYSVTPAQSTFEFDSEAFRENKAYRNHVLAKVAKGDSTVTNKSSLTFGKLIGVLTFSATNSNVFSSSHNVTNVNFLRKERLYTKLKYSRSPAYDIVSGGSAALLAAFLGFLISEKYGFEMVDSGDFYFLFMYLVFISFSVRPLLTTLDSSDSASSIFSLKPVATYFLNLVYLLLKKLK